MRSSLFQPAAITLALFTLPSLSFAAPLITEFMASGSSAPEDANGNTPDWIEIHNPDGAAVNLQDYTLTDDQEDLVKWTFPSVELDAGDYLIVFASGDDQASAGQELHTNFQLNGGGEYLALVDPAANVISEFNYPDQRGDVSYGWFGEEEQFFKEPTPGSENGEGLLGFIADTKFSVNRGFYDDAFELTITTETEGADIFYSLDGSDPSKGSIFNPAKKYTGPLSITTTTVVRAMAKKSRWQSTNTDTNTYVFPDDVVNQPEDPEGFPDRWSGTRENSVADYEMDPRIVDPNADKMRDSLLSLPSVSLVAHVDDLFKKGGIYADPNTHGIEVPMSCEWFNSDNTTEFQVDCGGRIQGGFFRQASASAKHSFRLLFKSEYGVERLRHDVLKQPGATTEFDTFVFRAGGNDGYAWGGAGSTVQFTRDEFGRQLAYAAGHPSPRGLFVHMYVNGLYWGLYNFTERPNEDFSASYLGGDSDDWDSVNSGEVKNAGGSENGNDPGNNGRRDWNQYISDARAAESFADYMALQGLDPDGMRNPDYKVFLDADHYHDYMIINLWGGNWDWPNKNFWYGRLNRPESTGFKHYVWDFENTMGNNRSRSPLNMRAPRNTDQVGIPWASLKDLLWFQIGYADRVQRLFFNEGILTPEKLIERYSEMADSIEMAIYAETARWGDDNRGNPYTIDEWRGERDWMLETYLPARSDIVLGQFEDEDLFPAKSAPVLSQHGGTVSGGTMIEIMEPSANIYYTTDGSDPFSYNIGDGAIEISETATRYENPIAINDTSVIKARFYARSIFGSVTWSPLTEATFTVGTDQIMITELMYHPTAPTDEERANGFTSASQFEYLVITNSGTAEADLAGVRFDSGINYSFEDTKLMPGEKAILVRNQAAFLSRYGAGHPVIGEYGGKLDDDGERLRLVDANDRVIQTFRYDDAEPWPVKADGEGASLVVVDATPGMDPDNAESWQEGTALSGEPVDSSGLIAWLDANGLADALGDPDNDDLKSLVEYLMGTDPKVPNGVDMRPQVEIRTLTVDGATGPYLVVSYPRSASVSDVEAKIETSADLNDWSVADDFVELASEGNREVVRSPAQVSEMGASYVRLLVSQK